jgi:GT2 family glycosyltransferase
MLSVIVNHYRSPELLKNCLAHLKAAVPAGSEIIVTDSGTARETREMMARDFPDITFLPSERNIGFGRSVNRALALARGDFFFISNADIVVQNRESLEEILSYLMREPQIGIVGPRLLNPDGTYQYSCFRFYAPFTLLARRTSLGRTPWGRRELDRFLIRERVGGFEKGVAHNHNAAPFSVDWLMGSALFVRRAAYEAVGPLDERYFMYMEDTDWCRTFWEHGWRVVYYPAVSFSHAHARASKKRNAFWDVLSNRYARIHLQSALKYFRKYGFRLPRYGV